CLTDLPPGWARVAVRLLEWDRNTRGSDTPGYFPPSIGSGSPRVSLRTRLLLNWKMRTSIGVGTGVVNGPGTGSGTDTTSNFPSGENVRAPWALSIRASTRPVFASHTCS